MAKPILKLFRPRGSPIIPVLCDPGADNQFEGKSRQRGHEIYGGGKILQFSTEIAVYL